MQIYRHDLRIQLTEALDANHIQDMSSLKQTLSSTHNSLVAFYKCTFYVKKKTLLHNDVQNHLGQFWRVLDSYYEYILVFTKDL